MKSSFFATKSVLQSTSTSTPTFAPAWMYACTVPSVAVRSPRSWIFLPWRTRRISIACSTSPSASASAFLQSIIPAPVRSRSAFTSLALISVELTTRSPPLPVSGLRLGRVVHGGLRLGRLARCLRRRLLGRGCLRLRFGRLLGLGADRRLGLRRRGRLCLRRRRLLGLGRGGGRLGLRRGGLLRLDLRGGLGLHARLRCRGGLRCGLARRW